MLPDFKFLAGSLCLDFANTVDWRLSERPGELLRSYGDLLLWSRLAGLIDAEEERLLARLADRDPRAAAGALDRARALREAIFRVFAALARGGEPPMADLDLLGRAAAEALARARLVRHGDRFAWQWPAEEGDLAYMLGPVAHSAAELLTSPELPRVRLCSDEACGWLFIDRSRNRSRRWCSMEDCGNRAKARRFYRRRRSRGGANGQEAGG